MVYRASLTTPPPPSPHAPITGPDDASVVAVRWMASLLLFVVLAIASHRGRLLFATGAAALALGWRIDEKTRRFRLTFEGDAIVIRTLLFGVLPVGTRRFDLAYTLSISDVRDEYDDVGLFLVQPFYVVLRNGVEQDGRFGSRTNTAANHAAYEAIRPRIESARVAQAALDVDRHLDPTLGELARYWPVIDPRSITRNAFGRVQSALTTAAIAHDELGLIPAGSTLYFAPDDGYRSRSTPDELTKIRFGAPTTTLAAKAAIDDRTTPSLEGATVQLFRFRRLRSSFLRRVFVFEHAFAKATVAGRAIVAAAPIESDDGALSRCTLDEPLVVAGQTYAAGAEIVFNGARQCMLTAQHPIEFRGRVVPAPAHVHFALKNPNASLLLRDILRAPDAHLAEPVQVHTRDKSH